MMWDQVLFVTCIFVGGFAYAVIRFRLRVPEIQRLVTSQARREVYRAVVRAVLSPADRTLFLIIILGGLAAMWQRHDYRKVAVMFAVGYALIGATTAVRMIANPLTYRRIAWRELVARGVPICELCGYDLTALSFTGRCPECGGAYGTGTSREAIGDAK